MSLLSVLLSWSLIITDSEVSTKELATGFLTA
jgi:hypothetical protein